MNKLKELESIQFLRGIAAVSVVAAHTNRITELYLNRNLHFSPPIFFDWGIDLFFIVSGFIIYYVHKKDFGVAQKLKNYSFKRFLRIYPLYWLANLLVIPLVFIYQNLGSGYERNPEVIIKSLLLFPQTHSPILFVGWTLVHEVRFYFIFGLLIWLKKKFGYLLIGILITLTIYRFAFNPEGNYLITDYLLSPFNLEFLLGCFGAHLFMSRTATQKLGFIFLISLFLLSLNFAVQNLERIILLGIPFTLIITLLAILEDRYTFKINKFLLFLGAASYSIYLTHYIFISAFIRAIIKLGFDTSDYLSLIMFLGFLGAILGGCLAYLLIEKPMLKKLKTLFA